MRGKGKLLMSEGVEGENRRGGKEKFTTRFGGDQQEGSGQGRGCAVLVAVAPCAMRQFQSLWELDLACEL